ncbi:D-aminoacid aminotransferase-like PLP-dependent enzyme [Fistulina hepatica ATCC 64428]|uniref:D-aminoacid aminotransferase-like PLP-dependent enzyme n=1 Tax=Fistulina hepatica ATCC 64428 TaxID=1128425 RepID=A0A0D7AJD4_9AGAR|nr:D-aminoacid aminotransferase-like PLP-dependent enzyme [Fistulina hepatica ATCC 64428]
MSVDAPSYDLLTSTRFDPLLLTLRWNNDVYGSSPYLLLPFHYDRLRKASALHGWRTAQASLSYPSFKAACDAVVAEQRSNPGSPVALKLRITLSREGELHVTASPVAPLTSDPTHAALLKVTDNPRLFGKVLDLRIDTQSSSTSSLFTSTKTTYRPVYDAARVRACIQDGENMDVLMYNERGDITETSICNIAFSRGGRWVTPPLSSGCVPGVLRRWLVEQGRVTQAPVRKDDVCIGEYVLLFNSVRGCRFSKVRSVDAVACT